MDLTKHCSLPTWMLFVVLQTKYLIPTNSYMKYKYEYFIFIKSYCNTRFLADYFLLKDLVAVKWLTGCLNLDLEIKFPIYQI